MRTIYLGVLLLVPSICLGDTPIKSLADVLLNDGIDPYIVGGNAAKPHSFPYQVGLILKMAQGNAWCGGTLISDKHILTAAHCLETSSAATVIIGAHNITGEPETTQIRINVTKSSFKVHEGWNRLKLANDIALITLPEPIKICDHARPVQLPRRRDISRTFVDEIAIASGWGKSADSEKTVSPILRYVEVPVIKKLACSIRYLFIINDSHICTNGKGGRSTCNGDSGGPLVVKDENDVPTLIGSTSFGIALGCEVGWPSVFTRTTFYLDWISENTGIKIRD